MPDTLSFDHSRRIPHCKLTIGHHNAHKVMIVGDYKCFVLTTCKNNSKFWFRSKVKICWHEVCKWCTGRRWKEKPVALHFCGNLYVSRCMDSLVPYMVCCLGHRQKRVISYPLVRRLRPEVIPVGSKIGNATGVIGLTIYHLFFNKDIWIMDTVLIPC